jgi:hypothetical protein
MKHLYSVLSLLLLFFSGQSQTLLQEGFETTFPPAGWTLINAGAGNDWVRTDDASLDDFYGSHGGAYAMVYEYSSSAAANAWMITPGVNLTSGISYTLSFYYHVASSTYPEKLKVTVGNTPTVAGQTNVLWNNNGGASLTNTAFALATITYTPTTTGTFYFGLNVYSAADQYALIVDDLRIEVTPTIVPACATNVSPANNATNVAAPNLTLSWTAVPGATGYDLYIGTTNPPTSLITNTGDNSIALSGAGFSTTYYWYVVPRNAAGAATGCTANVTSFTTRAIPPPPANDECASAISISPYNGTMSMSTVDGTASPGVTPCAVSPGTADEDVWFKFTALQNGTATINVTGGSSFDAVLQVFTGACGSLTQMGDCEDNALSGGTETMMLTGLIAGQTYYLRVYDWSSGTGDDFTINVSGQALPITLSTFRGVRQGSKNVLAWSTYNEQNNTGFELQRSADGRNFTSLSFVPTKAANGNSTTSIQYSFDDVKPIAGTNYYRLKQIDNDGKFVMSNIVTLKGEKVTTLQLTAVYPNPTIDRLNVIVVSPMAAQLKLVVTDLAGKVITQQTNALSAGDNNLSVSVNHLSAGSYFIKAICDNGCETAVQKFVKQ